MLGREQREYGRLLPLLPLLVISQHQAASMLGCLPIRISNCLSNQANLMLGFPGCPLMSIVVNTICAFIFIKFLLHLVIIYMYMHVYMWRTTCMSWFSPCSVPGTELGHQAWRLNPLSHSLVQAHLLCAFSWVSSKEVGLTERNSTCM